MRRQRLSAVTVAAVPIVLALVGSLAIGTVKVTAPWWPWAVWPVTGLLIAAAVTNEIRSRATGTQHPPAADVTETADLLAQAVRRQWQREEQQRKVHDPVALPVRWHPAAAQLVDHWANIHRAPTGASPGPIPVAGHLADVAHVYRRIPSGRLIILGPAGAGKTILAARLALDLLDTRTPGDPLPVIVSVASWNPTTTSLAAWLTDQLVRDHPGLAPNQPGEPDLATALLDTGLILPILDGFDEIPETLQRPALHQLNTTPDRPLIITSRPSEYTAAVAGTDVLTAAAVIELDELTLDDLADYLPRTTRQTTSHHRHTGIWDPVLTHLRDRPTDPASAVLRQALSTPLMVYLARTVYSDTPDHNPADLLNPTRYPTREAIEAHLISAYLPAVYQQPATTGRTWNPAQAHHWLAYLARHLDQLGTRDLAWWQLRDTIPQTTRTLVFGLVFGLAVGLAFEFVVGPVFGLAVVLVLGLVLGLAAGRAGGPAPARTHLRIRGSVHKIAKALTGGLAGGLGVGLVLGLAAGLVVGRTFGLVFGFVSGLVVVLGLGLGVGLVGGLQSPIDIAAEANPADSLTNDRRNTIRQVLTLTLAFGLAFGLAFLLPFGLPDGLVFMLAGGLVFGLAVGLMSGLVSAWGQWLIFVRIWLPLTGRLPWPIHTFLTDAHHRGVLRQAGAVYQFRHARLQDHLTNPANSP